MNWLQTLTIIGTITGLVLGIGGFMATHFEQRMSKQAERSDKLYEMFIDLLKEGR